MGLDMWVGVKRLGSQGDHGWNPGLLFIYSVTCGSLNTPCLPVTVRRNEGVHVEDPAQLPHTGRPQDVAGPPTGSLGPEVTGSALIGLDLPPCCLDSQGLCFRMDSKH